MESSETQPNTGLKGTLIKRDQPAPESKLKGRLIENSKGKASRDILKELARTDDIKHAPTWELDFDCGEALQYGDFTADGFEAIIYNRFANTDPDTGRKVFGQDAFAVSSNRRRFALADGLGGAADKLGTAFLAKFIADQVAELGADILFNEEQLNDTYVKAEKLFEELYERKFKVSRIKSNLGGMVATTISCVELIEVRSNGSITSRITVVGDSPVFLLDEHGTIVRAFGEDAQRGTTDSPLGFKVGVKQDGLPILLKKDTTNNGARIVDEIVTIPPNYRIVMGSDYFSETAHHEMEKTNKYGRVNEFTNLGPDGFTEKTKNVGKSDDATLIDIDPAKCLTR